MNKSIVENFSKAIFLVPISEDTWKEVDSVKCKFSYDSYIVRLSSGKCLVFTIDEAEELHKNTYLKSKNIIYPLLKQVGLPIRNPDGTEIKK